MCFAKLLVKSGVLLSPARKNATHSLLRFLLRYEHFRFRVCGAYHSYLRLRARGVYELNRARFFGEATESPETPDSCSSRMTWDGVFVRFEKFPFFVKLGHSEVGEMMIFGEILW